MPATITDRVTTMITTTTTMAVVAIVRKLLINFTLEKIMKEIIRWKDMMTITTTTTISG